MSNKMDEATALIIIEKRRDELNMDFIWEIGKFVEEERFVEACNYFDIDIQKTNDTSMSSLRKRHVLSKLNGILNRQAMLQNNHGYIYRRVHYKIETWVLLEEHPKIFKLSKDGQFLKFPKDYRSKHIQLFRDRLEAVQATQQLILDRIDGAHRSWRVVEEDIRINRKQDVVARIRYHEDEQFRAEFFPIIARHPKSWECDTQYNKKLPKGRIRGQFFQAHSEHCNPYDETGWGKWIFDCAEADDFIAHIENFLAMRVQYLTRCYRLIGG